MNACFFTDSHTFPHSGTGRENLLSLPEQGNENNLNIFPRVGIEPQPWSLHSNAVKLRRDDDL